ncbi:MAG: ribonuclease, partial [Lachnospiraceae bacterium]|nr:ribonuclease [Lachnospiraceae bacterium]
YNHLPSNYITKKEAQNLGWDASQGKHLNKVAPGKSIGGDKFGNREGLLPKKDGRVYYECDIDYKKGSRNAKRIVFSNDGLIYYTEDHYETYELLYE